MKNNIQFALIKRNELNWQHVQYQMTVNENIENNFGLILLLMSFAQFFYTRGHLDIGFGKRFFDYNEKRLSWKPYN